MVVADTKAADSGKLEKRKKEARIGFVLRWQISSGTFRVQLGKGAKPQVSRNGPC
jgi:hypothetical protein